MSESDERVKLTKMQAIKLLPLSPNIHTFRQVGPTFVCADWTRSDIVAAMLEYGFELSGERATAMGHGMVFLDEIGHIFVETKKEER